MSLEAGEEKVTVADLAVVWKLNLEIDSQPKQRGELPCFKWSCHEKARTEY